MRHLTEIDLLEIGRNPELSDHLDSCSECHERFEPFRIAITNELESPGVRVFGKPESFWLRQRDQIHARVSGDPAVSISRLVRWTLLAAVLVTAIALSATMIMWDDNVASEVRGIQTAALDQRIAEEMSIEIGEAIVYDPWESEDLEPFHQALEWETWIEDEMVSEETS